MLVLTLMWLLSILTCCRVYSLWPALDQEKQLDLLRSVNLLLMCCLYVYCCVLCACLYVCAVFVCVTHTHTPNTHTHAHTIHIHYTGARTCTHRHTQHAYAHTDTPNIHTDTPNTHIQTHTQHTYTDIRTHTHIRVHTDKHTVCVSVYVCWVYPCACARPCVVCVCVVCVYVVCECKLSVSIMDISAQVTYHQEFIIYRGEYPRLYCPFKTHCVKLLRNTHHHQMVLTCLKSYKHATCLLLQYNVCLNTTE